MAFFADNYIHDVGEEELIAICETWFEGFPDLTHEIKQLAADGDWVLGRLVLCGTHDGPYKGILPTGNEVEIADHFATRFADGKIVTHHATADEAMLFRQLDVRLPPARPPQAENETLVRRYFEALNDRDKERFRDTMAEDFTYGDIRSRDAMVQNDWKWLQALDLT